MVAAATHPSKFELFRSAAEGSVVQTEPGPDSWRWNLTLIGKWTCPYFVQLRVALEFMASEGKRVEAVFIEGYFEAQFEQRVKQVATEYGGAFKQAKTHQPLVFAERSDGQLALYFPSPEAFFLWGKKRLKYHDASNFIFYKRKANKAQMQSMIETGRSYTSLSFSIGGAPAEKVCFELFSTALPATCAAFQRLLAHPPMLNSLIHRVVVGGWIQGGDWVDGSGRNSKMPDGAGGEEKLADESFIYKFTRPGLLCLANDGVVNTGGSQFFITLKELPHLDDRYIIFGRVISGMRTIHRIGKVPCENERPIKKIRITEMGADLVKGGSDVLRAEVQEEMRASAEELHAIAADDAPEEMHDAASKIGSIFRGRQLRKEQAKEGIVFNKPTLQKKSPKKKLKMGKPKAKADGSPARRASQPTPTDEVEALAEGAPESEAERLKREAEEEAAAALKVQKLYRGNQARKEVKGKSARKPRESVVTRKVDDMA